MSRLYAITVLLLSGAASLLAQGGSMMSAPSNTTALGHDSISDPIPPSMEPAHGIVVKADGSATDDLIEIHAFCGGAVRLIGTSDTRGRFDVNLAILKDMPDPKACVMRASLDGYQSDSVPLASVRVIGGVKLGTITLKPLSPNPAGVTSATGADVSKTGRKAYEQGLAEASRFSWASGRKSLQKAVAADPAYSSAWLSLGILQAASGDRTSAQKSFAAAAKADPAFALPWIRLAALDAARADWQATVFDSQKAINLNPAAFPQAYELNVMGNLYLINLDVAEKSSTAGMQLDPGRQYPEFEYMLGAVLLLKKDRPGALKHFKTYVEEAPNASHVAGARMELTRLQASR